MYRTGLFLAALLITVFVGNAATPEGNQGSALNNDQTKFMQQLTDPEDTSHICIIEITTDFGVMTAQLYNATPLHRDNFVKLAEEGYYDSLLFHRVIAGFMIQGGDPGSKNAAPGVPLGAGGPNYQVPAEFVDDLIHLKGAIAAARTG